MEEKNRLLNLSKELFAILIFLFVGFYVNRYIKIKGLYMDDLYMWSCYGEQSYLEFAFPFRTSTRFRPVYWTLTYLEMMVVRNHPELFVPVNILLNVGTAYLIYRFAKRLSHGGMLPGLISGSLYLISHFAYYQIGQALGLLETMSLFMAIVILWLLYEFLHSGKRGLFGAALAVYFLLVLSHERYLALAPLFYLVLIFRTAGKKKPKRALEKVQHLGQVKNVLLWISPALTVIILMLLRRFFIGTAIPAGTGGTEVTDTFSLLQAVQFALQQVLYIFGINAGPEYLSGINWLDVKQSVQVLVYLSWIPLLLLVTLFFYHAFKNGRINSKDFWGEQALFLGFIALCIGCSSITIRVEMRWIYVNYAAALLYLSYMIGQLGTMLGETQAKRRYQEAEGSSSHVTDEPEGEKSRRPQSRLKENSMGRIRPIDARREQKNFGIKISRRYVAVFSIFFLMYAGLMAPVEKYYRSHFYNIYFWEDQDRMNSLAEETVEKYGVDSVLGKQVYILENQYGMSDFYGRTFFKVYDPEKTGQGTEIHFVTEVSEIPDDSTKDNAIVLKEVPEKRGYQDVTAEVLP